MPRQKAPLVERTCEWCSTIFEIKSNKHNRFCSRSCAIKKTNTGRKHSDEINKKKGHKGELNGFYGKKHTEETKSLIGLKNKKTYEEKYGSEKALDLRKQQSTRMTGTQNSFYGKKHTDESRAKISENHADLSGENNPMYKKGYKLKGDKNGSWKGGISFGDYGFEFNNNLKTKIRKRDKFTCAACNKNGYSVHHIDYNKINNSEVNLITLCRSCHGKTNFRREEWNIFFNSLILKKQHEWIKKSPGDGD